MSKLLERMVQNKIETRRAKEILSKYKKARWVGRGRHSVVLKSGDLAIKIEKDVPDFKGASKDEAYFLNRLNKYGIGPKYRGYSNKLRYVRYDYVKGKFLIDFLKEADERKIRKIIKICLEKAFKMDLLKINKTEFHKPLKHVLIHKNDAKFIDFERCHYTTNPKNVSQLISFFFKNKNTAKILKNYKKNISNETFQKVLKSLNLD